METRCSESGPEIGLVPLSATRVPSGAARSRETPLKPHQEVPTLPRTFHLRDFYRNFAIFSSNRAASKIWDTYTGQCLHSFPHNHIVRTVALSSTSSRLLTGGQEKKARIFDVNRPDAPPDFLEDTNGLAHEGTVKSVIWVAENLGVTAGEDGNIKCVTSCNLTKPVIDRISQVVGPEVTRSGCKHIISYPNHLYGAFPSNKQTRRRFWQNRRLYLRCSQRSTNS